MYKVAYVVSFSSDENIRIKHFEISVKLSKLQYILKTKNCTKALTLCCSRMADHQQRNG